jgi:hypothetical protein
MWAMGNAFTVSFPTRAQPHWFQIQTLPILGTRKIYPAQLPVTIGCAPYHLQRLNTSTNLGQLVITHRPVKTPLWHGTYQLVIGAAAASCYSITVTARIAEAAVVVVDRHMNTARHMQLQLPQFDRKLTDAWTSMRLSERKLLVLQQMMDEAETESARCEREISECNEELAKDEVDMALSDADRLDLYNEVSSRHARLIIKFRTQAWTKVEVAFFGRSLWIKYLIS